MTTSAELVDELNGTAGRAGYAAFAAGCAARLGPVFESFARTGHGRYADWLAELQACIDAPELARSRKLQGQVKAAPEASIDDSNRPDYYAMRALGVLFYAVQVLSAGDMAAAALRCARASLALLRDFDYVLSTPAGSPGAFTGLELRAERESLDMLKSSLSGMAGRQAMAEATTSDLYRRLQEVSGEIALVHDWNLDQWR
jgi:hypothetical protein